MRQLQGTISVMKQRKDEVESLCRDIEELQATLKFQHDKNKVYTGILEDLKEDEPPENPARLAALAAIAAADAEGPEEESKKNPASDDDAA